MKKTKILITAGPTLEMIDPVRYISNLSSGKQGYLIAETFAENDFDVTLVSGEVKISPPKNINLIKVQSAQQMLDACLGNLPCDVFIACAAVCDWRPLNFAKSKLKKQKNQEKLILEFVKNPDILYQIANHNLRPKAVIGFAAETDNLIENAKIKLKNKNCDAIFANDVSSNQVFGKDDTHLHVITSNNVQNLGDQSKSQSAQAVLKAAIDLIK